MKLIIVLLLASVCLANPTPPHRGKTTTPAKTTSKTTAKATTTGHSTAPPAAGKCGVPAIKPSTDENIVGGTDAVPYSWPWQVALFQKSIGGSSFQFCSGTVISNQWIMTAGHCFVGQENKTSQFTVKLGVFKKADNDEPEEVVLGVSEIHVNPKYQVVLATPRYDITLLKLEKPVDFDEDVSPVCLPVQDEELPAAGTGVWITGWGDTTEGGKDSQNLEQTSVPVVDSKTCLSTYPTRFDDTTQFCAGLKQGGKDTCQGDSGGPVVYQDPVTGAWKQLGITSWGQGCAEPNEYGVYSKVSEYLDFIHQYVPDV